MKNLLLLCCVIVCFTKSSQAQFVYKIKADSVLITNDSCNAELNLENSTKNVLGFLYNKGIGRTEFRKVLYKQSDTLYLIGGDSLKLNGLGNYILNQSASAQTADAWISGKGSFSGGISAGAQYNTTNVNPTYYSNYKAQVWGPLIVEGTNASQVRFTGSNPYNPSFVFDGSTDMTSMYKLTSQNLSTSSNGSTYFSNNKVIINSGAYIETFQQPLTVKKAYPAAGGSVTLSLDNDTLSSPNPSAASYKILQNKFSGTEVSYLTGNGGAVFTADAIVNGHTIGKGASSGSQNMAVGNTALSVNTTGDGNTAIGYFSLKYNTTGEYNSALGLNSLQQNTIGNYNAAVGVNALQLNTIGGGNTAIGASAMVNSTTGGVNTAIGWTALGNNSTGSYNTAVGTGALRDNATSNNNTGIGYGVLTSSTGTGNAALGALALYSNTTGNYNNAFGGSLYSNTTGSNNTAMGAGGLYGTTTGSNNTAFGYSAGSNLTTGSSNIFIGASVQPNISITNSNQLNIGNWIYGDNGKISIGVTAPTAKFHLPAGTSSANTAPLKFTSGTNLTTAEAGAVEYDGTNYFVTNSSARYTLAKTLTATSTLNFASTAAGTSTDLTITVTGAADGDAVALGVPSASVLSNGSFSSWVSATNTVTVRFSNNGSGALDPASGTFRVSVTKY